ncbi:hypothetical protein PIIN_09293 [Serendipita indica DSM 11827]|uniref:F-box domain-containing protein n=1 Tax=Serendipita indica (strain DSM 11827) TaxID=1109443 RepID=G4TVG5_SERID|nr:hypothetical protein PIIN_09293 [Serendipita indica DSM 11827]
MDDERIQLLTELEQYLDSLLPSLISREKFAYSSTRQADLQPRIDDAILRVEGSLCRALAVIRRERNLMSPVSSLPPEVLANIFSYGTFADTLRASWVSRTWRLAAINAPSLWIQFEWYRYTNADFRALQLARCRALALELDLDWSQSEIFGVHSRNNEPLSNVLSRASSITHLTDLYSLKRANASRLQSLHVHLSPTYALDPLDVRLETPVLRHLSIEMLDWCLSNKMLLMDHLQTLHLQLDFRRTGSGPILGQIAELAQLQEFSVRFVPPGSNGDRVNMSNQVLSDQPALKRVYLYDTSFSFQQAFFCRFRLSQYTNVEISPFHLPSHWPSSQLRGEVTTDTLWIDQKSGVSLYDHGASVTKITKPIINGPLLGRHRYRAYPYKLSKLSTCTFPESLPLDKITSLIINNGPPPTSHDLRSLVQLKRLCFTFYQYPIHPVGEPKLAETLDEQLVKSCPHLSELIMVRDGSYCTDEDEAVQTVLSFLKAWHSEYQAVFGVLRVSNAISSQMWSAHRDILSSMTGLFELAEADFERRSPEFPEPRHFVAKSPSAYNAAAHVDSPPLFQVDSPFSTLDFDPTSLYLFPYSSYYPSTFDTW